MIYVVAVFYFMISGLSFIDAMPDHFYALQSQIEVFLAFMVGLVCCFNNRPKMLIVFCAYSLYVLISDYLFSDISILQWGLELMVFACLAFAAEVIEFDIENN